MQSSDLEQKTKAYWSISMAYHVGVGSDLNTSQAIRYCTDTPYTILPTHPLKWRLSELNDRIIRGRTKRRKTDKHPNPIVRLRPAVNV